MTNWKRLNLEIAAVAGSLLLVTSGCDNKEDGGNAASSAAARGSAAEKSAPKKKEPDELVKELANPATREAAKQALIDYEWDKVAGGFPLTVKIPLEELLTGSTDHGAVKAAIEVCDKIGPAVGVSYVCDDALKLLIKKNNMLSSDEAKANRDRACNALSPGGSDAMKEACH